MGRDVRSLEKAERCCCILYVDGGSTGGTALTFRDLSFPHVNYRRTGLQTVVCQLKFDPILRIGLEPPVAFQDEVRHAFPKFFQEESAGFRIAPGAGVEALPPTPATWRFRTDDDAWTAGLAINFLSLETQRYQHFREFEGQFSILHEALRSAYGVDHYSRVGLRYVNVFKPEEFPGGWLHRFNPQLLGPMADPSVGSEVAESRQVFVLSNDDWTIKVLHGSDNGRYLLDIDHATEARVEANGVAERLRAFNRNIYQVFRWAISEAMHEEMEPVSHA